MLRIKRNGFLPPIEFYPYFSEHPEKYEKYKNGEIVSIPENLANKLECKVIKEYRVEQPVDVEKIEHSDLDEIEKKDYKNKLMNVKGIGDARAEEIAEKYPNIKELKEGLKSNDSLDLSNSMIEGLKNEVLNNEKKGEDE